MPLIKLVSSLPIDFKTARCYEEWRSGKLEPRLFSIFMGQIRFVQELYYPHVIEITSIFRQDLNSVHGYWRGLDWVIRNFHVNSYKTIVDWTNKNYPYQKIGHMTCMYHDAGSGYHVHNQVCDLKEVMIFG